MRLLDDMLAPALVILGVVSSAVPGFASQATTEGKKLVYRDAGQTIVVQAWGRDGLRVRIIPDGSQQTSDWALDVSLETRGQIRISDTDAVIRNGKISARIQDTPIQRGHMQFFRHRGDKPGLLALFPTLEMLTFRAGAFGDGAIDGTDISITVPRGADVTALAPTYTVSPGATGTPASGTPLNFNHPQNYTITAPDKKTRKYRVTVRFALIYDFNDGTLQGWHNRVWDTSLNAGQGGWTDLAPNITAMPAHINGGRVAPANANNALFRNAGTCFLGNTATFILSGNHLDYHRNTLWLRSPEFLLDGSGDLTFQLLAGTGAGVAPATDSLVPFAAGDIKTTGWIGLCLRDATTGAKSKT